MDKLKMQSENLVEENVERIATIFPNCITEGKNEKGETIKLVDFDLLKQELSKDIVEGNDERYVLNWAGKKQAILTANSPIAKTLRPCKEESVDFENTQNLYIEGDNLDVLKLLRETYLNKVKMIYIDPPYNTGNDFVYNDDFAIDTDEYLKKSNQVDEDDNRMVVNNDSNGRFHTDWLNMLYPRLKLAKDLLTDDGVIFISIDDNEQANLRKICDEVFGNSNFLGEFVWHKKTQPSFLSREIAIVHEYIFAYKKNSQQTTLKGGLTNIDRTSEMINIGNPVGERILPKESVTFENGNFTGTLKAGTYGNGVLVVELLEDIFVIEGKAKSDVKIKSRIVQSQKTIYEGIANGWEIYIKNTKSMRPTINKNLKEAGIKPPISLLSKKLNEDIPTNTDASTEIKDLFNGINIMDYPKPTKLIKYLTETVTYNDKLAITLDFFSGSATTAHAVMQLNAEDGGNRKFIMVQLPEKTSEESEAYKAGYKNICEIGKERIRKAGLKILQPLVTGMGRIDGTGFGMGMPTTQNEWQEITKNVLDIGFRDLKLDSSCMKDIYYNPSELTQGLLYGLEDNIKEDRTPEDLLFQVMLDMGVLLSSEIKTSDIKGKKVFNVNDGNLVCCFDKNLTDEVVTEIAKMKPLYAVFRDSSMATDSVAVNFDQIFETYSPTTTRKVI